MSWNHSSRLALVAVVVLVLVASVGVASAISVEQEDAPDDAEVGEEITLTVELQDLYADESSWELNGLTDLENAEWSIELYQDGPQIDTVTQSEDQPQPVQLDESDENAPDRVVVELTGTVPEVSNYSYEEPATFLAGEVVQYTGNPDPPKITEHRIHHYTTGDPGSQEARTALDDASDAIQAASDDGADVSDAQSTFDDAVSAYDGGEFGEAVSLAEDAQSQAESSGSGSDGSSDGGSDDGSDGSDGSSGDDGSNDGDDSSGSDDGTSDGSSDGTDDAASDDGSSEDGSGATNESDADGNDTQSDGNDTQTGDDGNATDDGSDDSDDGGLLWPILYGLFGLLILGGVLGGVYWYQQQSQGPNRDPLG